LNRAVRLPKSASERGELVRRSIGMVLGVLFVGVGVGFYRMALFGMDPFQTLMGGLDAIIPAVSFGTLWLATLITMLIVPLIFKRSLIGAGTIINLLAVGYAIDVSHQFMLTNLPNHNMGLRILWLSIGLIIIAMAMAFYFTANMGVSAYDAIALVIAERHPRIPFKYWRIICDWTCLIVGVALFLLAGNGLSELTKLVGIGTIIAAFGMGPLITLFSEKIARPVLYRTVVGGI